MAHATGLVASWMASSGKTGLNWICGVPGSQGSLVVRGSSVIKGMEGRLMTGGGGGLGEMKWKDHGGPGGKEIRAGKPLVRPNLGFTSKSCASLTCVQRGSVITLSLPPWDLSRYPAWVILAVCQYDNALYSSVS